MTSCRVLAACCFAWLSSFATAGWTPLVHQPTSFNVGPSFLLMDGRVLVNDPGTIHWYTLTPDIYGSYVNGTWSQVGDTKYDRLYFASGVFSDGRVIICGGEYSNGAYRWINNTEIFDPVTDTWTEIAPPTGWNNVGDAPSVIMPDGKFLVGSDFDGRTALYDPRFDTWQAGANRLNGNSDEETWTLLPDGTVMGWNCFGHPGSQRYLPSINKWIDCGNTPVDLVLTNSLETGPAILMPNGKTFCMGGPPVSCLYTMPNQIALPGTWTVGPVPPQVGGQDMGAEDAPAALLPNGNVLLALGPVAPGGGNFGAPTYYFEYDGTNITQVDTPPNNGGPAFVTTLLVLPSGEVLETVFGNSCYVYTHGGGPQPGWKPSVMDVPNVLEKGLTYQALGQRFTGVTNGSSYGDEINNATTYPLFRATSPTTGRVVYLNSHSVSTRAVQTGSQATSAQFDVPVTMLAGRYQFQAVASGMASDPVTVDVPETFPTASFSVFRGRLVSGGVNELFESDDSYLRVGRGLVLNPNESPIQVDFTTFCGTANPAFLAVSVEDGANTPSLVRTVQLLNVNTNTYEVVDVGGVDTGDTVSIVKATGSLSRFVNPVNKSVVVRLSYLPGGLLTTANYAVRFDRVVTLSY